MEELPDSLDETYSRILREIRKPNEGHARRMLQCLVGAVRPLRVAELAEVLAFDFSGEGIPKLNPDWRWEDHEEAVMSTCSSLVMIVDDKGECEHESDDGLDDESADEGDDGFKDDSEDEDEDESESDDGNKDKSEDSRIVQFSHFSVKEFLMSDRLAESSRPVSHYHVEPEAAHTILAQACLGILLRLDDRVDRDKIKNFPFAEYAARHWVEHARFKGVSSHIKDGMECLFDADKPHLSAWLWIYNEDRIYLGKSMATMFPEKLEANPLYYAAVFGFRDLTARLLTEHPEGVHVKGGSQVTPFHASAYYGSTDVFSLLVEYFPNLDLKDYLGRTPLHLASFRGHVGIGKQLLDHGVDVNAHDDIGWTPLWIAACHGQVAFARMLLENGAMTNKTYPTTRTPLHGASARGHVEVVRLLLEHGADPTECDVFGRTPSETALGYRQLEVVQLLSQSFKGILPSC